MTIYEQHASDVRAFLATIGDHASQGERTLAERAGAVLDAYETKLRTSDVPQPSVPVARLALAVQIDQAVRAEKRVRGSAWSAAAHTHLFGRRNVTPDDLRRFHETAIEQGSDYAALAAFLETVLDRLEGRRRTREGLSARPAVYLGLSVVLLIAALAVYAGFLDYRYHAALRASFEDELKQGPVSDPVARLAHVADLSERVGRAAAQAPLAEIIEIPIWNSGTSARERYAADVAAFLPNLIGDALADAMATEGEDIEQYDSLRAWSVLSGASDWQPGYLAAWLADRDAALGTGALSRHVKMLSGPVPTMPPPDAELLAQAVGFASAATEEARAFLELTRMDAVAELADWTPAGIPGLADVVFRRSGDVLTDGVPAIFTAEGWRFANSVGVGLAVQKARGEALKLFPTAQPRQNDAPDRVLALLQDETLARWKFWLADLRVRPFDDQTSAIRISGALAQRRSPLEGLIRAVWIEAGGEDRTRPHAFQLRIATEFGAAIQYVEAGRMAEIGNLFASLNVALSAIEFDEEAGAEKLMDVQEVARSVTALRAAPPLVSQIVEDVLAQTSAAHASLLANPLTREWQRLVFPACLAAVDGRYPFAEGADASASSFAEFLGPRGLLPRFVESSARAYLDKSGETWRWKPEARLAGVGQESAAFLQQSMAVSAAFFGEDGQLGDGFDIAALAERGEASVTVGGVTRPVRATGGNERLEWPGPDPQLGSEVALRQGANTARELRDGIWGLLRLLDATRLRPRDGGKRYLVDLRSDSGRLFFEMTFDTELNPVSGRRFAKGMVCPPVL
ncbi:MAG: ImcF-related family protein [Pseudomonadota bacterium]